jgi:hypothetical protein
MSKDLTVKVGTYKDKGTGQDKGEYVRIGTTLSNDNGEYILMDIGVDLAGLYIKQSKMNREAGKETKGSSLMVSVFERESRMSNQQSNQANNFQQPQGQSSADGGNAFDDDIPFAPLSEHG